MGPQMELTWTPAPQHEADRIGATGAPLTDYMLHPPKAPGAQVGAPPALWPGCAASAPDPATEQAACGALEALITAALDP